MAILFRTALLLLLFSVCSCSIFTGPDEVTILSFEKEYSINLTQEIKPGPNIPIVEVRAIKSTNCEDAHLQLYTEVDNNQVELHIPGINQQFDCRPIAKTLKNQVGLYLPNGNYDFYLVINSIINNDGNLHIEDTQYNLEMFQSHAVVYERTNIQVIPDQIFWGRIGMENGVNESILNDIKILIGKSYPQANLSIGHYGIFNIDELGQILLEEEQPNHPYQDFVFGYDMDLERISNLIQNLREIYPFIQFKITTGLSDQI